MNDADAEILFFINQLAFNSRVFDYGIYTISTFYFSKGVVLVGLMWWVWFESSKEFERNREIIVATVISGFIVLVVGRLLAFYLPFRIRPMYNPEVRLQFPHFDDSTFLQTWSSFPSDHAMLWFAIAFGIYLASKRIGVIALGYTAIVICFPRLYLGLHYPSDILVGAALGISMAYLANTQPVRHRLTYPFVQWSRRHPPSFYFSVFLLSYAMATHFEELKEIAALVIKAMLKAY